MSKIGFMYLKRLLTKNEKRFNLQADVNYNKVINGFLSVLILLVKSQISRYISIPFSFFRFTHFITD